MGLTRRAMPLFPPGAEDGQNIEGWKERGWPCTVACGGHPEKPDSLTQRAEVWKP
jgi:hypothetical protein